MHDNSSFHYLLTESTLEGSFFFSGLEASKSYRHLFTANAGILSPERILKFFLCSSVGSGQHTLGRVYGELLAATKSI